MDQGVASQLIGIVFLSIIVTYPFCRIYKRAGFNWYWGLITLLPIAGFFSVICALAYSNWPSNPDNESEANGSHTLYWLAFFTAIFLFGIPGISSSIGEAILTAVSIGLLLGAVGSIYSNAGFSGWGWIMGLFGITNMIWPWLIAFREWPSQKVEEGSGEKNTASSQKPKQDHNPPPVPGSLRERAANRTLMENNNKTAAPASQNQNISDSAYRPASDKYKAEVKKPPVPEMNKKEIDKSAFYKKILTELSGDSPRSEALYLQAQVESDGDEEKLRLIYSKYRLKELEEAQNTN